ncbi:MAG: TolC family protein [Gemmataceae bacterium]
MTRKWASRLFWGVAAAGLGGCHTPTPAIDATLQQIAAPIDAGFSTLPAAAQVPAKPKTDATPEPLPPPTPGAKAGPQIDVPPELPGAEAEVIPPTRTKEERAALVKKLYSKPLPLLAPDVPRQPGPDGRPLTLADLQALAAANSPTLNQAAADVEAARGNLIQAGLLPNPTVGFEADTVGSGHTAGQQGGYIDQTIKTGGKIRLGQASAAIDLANAQVALRRAQVDLTAKVRGGYFAVVIAQEIMTVARALVKLTDETYRLHLARVEKANLDAPYEPMALRVLAVQARMTLVQAHNRYVSAWNQLAAALNAPDMPPTELAGRPDMPLPKFQYEAAVAQIRAGGHTELMTAQNAILRAQYQLRLAQVTPIPDVLTHFALQRDYTAPPFGTTVNVQIGVPLAVFDRNQGNILQAQAQLGRAIEEVPRVRNDLAQRLAEAFERYNNALALVQASRADILPDQVRTYRGVINSYQVVPDKIGVADIVNAQQTLSTAIQNYLTALTQAWQAATDIANLMQLDDLFGAGCEMVLPIPKLD